MLTSILGTLGVLTILVSSTLRKRDHLLVAASIGSLFFALHYFLLDAKTASYLNFFSCLLALFSILKDRYKFSVDYILYLSLLIVLLVGIFSWSGMPSLFSTLGLSLIIIGRWQKTPQTIRSFLIFGESCWLIHNILVYSIPTIIGSVFIIVVTILSYIRYKYKP